jgi:uncharacterized protein
MTNGNNWKHLLQSRMSRRNFLRGMSVAGAGAAVAGVVPGAVLKAVAAPAGAVAAAQAMGLPFAPTDISVADDVVVPEGYTFQVIIKRGDVFTRDGKTFGDNADWTGWYPIDMLEGGDSYDEGLLTVNNEYLNPLLVSGYTGEGEKTVDQINLEKDAVGMAVVHIRKVDGLWTVVTDSDFARRFDARTSILLSGPVAGTPVVGGATEVIGTLGNCSGGQTPWMTALSCEENYQSYYGEDSVNEPRSEYGWEAFVAEAQMPEHFGWVVEIDPFSGIAKKRTALGRFRHENVAIGIGATGKVVAYMGDDKRDEVVYKFVSANSFDPNNREANLDILDSGTLYAADFGRARWIPVVWEGNEEVLGDPDNVGGYTLAGQADVLTYCAQAARALGATRTDRPEDIEIHPSTGDVYIAFTNNSNHGNFHGQITRIMEADGDFEATTFMWDIFAVGGPQSGFSSPDNLIFDANGNLWTVTDVSSSSLNSGIYEFMGNNALFMLPTSGEQMGRAFRFASGPIECEMTGPTWIGGDTLILAVQHPGEESASLSELTSHWPEGGDAQPRAGVIAIVGPFNALGNM